MAATDNQQDNRAKVLTSPRRPLSSRIADSRRLALWGKFDGDRAGTDKSNIYKQVRKSRFSGVDANGFHVIDSPSAFIRHFRSMIRFQGIGAINQFAKSFSRRRPCFILVRNGSVANFGTLSIGFCKDYAVENDAVVIGTIWTDEEMRGTGLATLAIRAAMNYMIDQGRHTFYIDTAVVNKPMLRSIEKLEFGEPSGTFVVRG